VCVKFYKNLTGQVQNGIMPSVVALGQEETGYPLHSTQFDFDAGASALAWAAGLFSVAGHLARIAAKTSHTANARLLEGCTTTGAIAESVSFGWHDQFHPMYASVQPAFTGLRLYQTNSKI
jgi:hypothetical protein